MILQSGSPRSTERNLTGGSGPVSWFLRSLADAHTHWGGYSTVTRSVQRCAVWSSCPARCRGAAPRCPLDPDQVCPDRRRVEGDGAAPPGGLSCP